MPLVLSFFLLYHVTRLLLASQKSKRSYSFHYKNDFKIFCYLKDKKTWHFQLRIEQRGGRVFVGWNEGNIYFPPTYKYSNNSDKYAGDDMNQKEKRRTPAWYFSCGFLCLNFAGFCTVK